jgi:hypothetical protein
MKLLSIALDESLYSLNIPPNVIAHALIVDKDVAFFVMRLLTTDDRSVAAAVADARARHPEIPWVETNSMYDATPRFLTPAGESNVRYIKLVKDSGKWCAIYTTASDSFFRAQTPAESVAAPPEALGSNPDILQAIKAQAHGRKTKEKK